jgi:serine/threonine protein kinase/WD40 repeat protein
MPVDAARAKSLFLAASDLTDPGARAAYLERECAGDAELRGRVEALLRASDVAPLLPGGADRTQTHASQRLPVTEDGADASVALGTVIAGKYKLVQVIGEGGMGCVYLARQNEPVQRMVAIKLIRPGMDSRAVLARFDAERQALAVMDHPNIARILDGGLHDNRPFFVMELVKGTPITRFSDERKLTPRERLELFVPVCQAIQHAHQKGIIHRDIKPSNVLVALYDDRAVPKVIDFGVAKATATALTDVSVYTGFGALVGTPEYMSPEQASLNNLDIDTRSDVYALGVLLYELLTGTTPVDRKQLRQAEILEVLRIVREVEAPRPSTKLSSSEALPTIAAERNTEPAKLSRLMKGELDWILLKALEKDRTRRYESANGFAADVQRYLAGEPVQAVPPSVSYRFKKFLKRHKGPVVAAVLVLAVLIVGIIGTTVGLIGAENARHEEARQRAEAETAQQNAQNAQKEAEEARKDATKELRNATEAKHSLEASQTELRATLYSARMNLMRSALNIKDTIRAMELLDLTYATGKADDPSGFEWHYWDRQLRPYLGTFPSNALFTPEFSRDGSRCLSLGYVSEVVSGRTVWKWDPSSKGMDSVSLSAVCLSPDGTLVANLGNVTGKGDLKRFQVWDVERDARTLCLEKTFPGRFAVARLAADNHTVAAVVIGRTNRHVMAWDLTTGKELFTREVGPKTIANIVFNAAGTELLVFTGTFFAMPVSRTSKFPHSKGVAGSVEVWDARTGKTRVALAGPFPDGVSYAAFSQDGRWIATAQLGWESVVPLVPNPSVVKLWDAATGKEVRTMAPLPPFNKVPPTETQNFSFSLAFSATGDRLAASWVQGSHDGGNSELLRFQVWDVATGETRFHSYDYEALGDRTAVCFGAGGQLLYLASAVGRIYDGLRDDRVSIYPKEMPPGEVAVAGGGSRFDPGSGRPRALPPVRVAVPGMVPLEMVCSPKGDQFATLWSNGTRVVPDSPRLKPSADLNLELRVGDSRGHELFRKGELLDSVPHDHAAKGIQTHLLSRKVFFSPDGRKVACLVTCLRGQLEQHRAARDRFNNLESTVSQEIHIMAAARAFAPLPMQLNRLPLPQQHMQQIHQAILTRRRSVAQAELEKELAKLDNLAIRSQLRVWDLDSGQELRGTDASNDSPTILPNSEDPPITDACFTTNGTQLTALRQRPSDRTKTGPVGGCTVVTWEVATGQQVGSFTHDVLFNQVLYVRDGKSMICAGPDAEQYYRVDAQSGRDLERLPVNLRDGVRVETSPRQRIILSPDGTQFHHVNGAGPWDRNSLLGREITLFNLANLRQPTQYKLEWYMHGASVTISPDTRRLVAAGTLLATSTGEVQQKKIFPVVIWDKASGLILSQIDLPSPAQDLRFTPDSQHLGCVMAVDERKAVEFRLLEGSPQAGRAILSQLRR